MGNEEEMRDGVRTFSYKTGVVIVSQNELVSEQLRNNNNFRPLHNSGISPLRVFYSKDLTREIGTVGIPLFVKKFIHTLLEDQG